MGSSASREASPDENDRESKAEDEHARLDEEAERRAAGLPVGSAALLLEDGAKDLPPLTSFPSRERLRAWQDAAPPPDSPAVADEDGRLPPFPSRVRRDAVFKGRSPSSSGLAGSYYAPMEEFGQKLLSSCPTDFDKVDAVYTMIVSVDATKIDIADEETPADYLQRSRGDKHVLLALFQKLLSLCNVQCEIVRGYAKGSGYGKGKAVGPLSEPNHHWLAAAIDSNWHLIDIIWSCQQKTDYYYLTEPELFVVTHMPLDSRWQLLSRPVTADEFYAMAAISQSFVLHGLQLVDQLTQRVVDSTGEEKFRFAYRKEGPLKEFSFNYALEKKNAFVTSVSGVRLDRCVLIEKRGGTVTYTFYFPAAGDYKIEILCKDAAASSFSNVVTYSLTCKRLSPRLRPFPKNDAIYWGATERSESLGITVDSPARVTVEHGSKQIPLQCPHSLALAYELEFESPTKFSLSECLIDYYDDTKRYVDVQLPEAGFYVLNIYTYGGCDSDKMLACRYLLDCVKAHSGKPNFAPRSRLGHQPVRRALLEGIEKRNIALLRAATKMASESRFTYLIDSDHQTALALLGQLERLDKIKSEVMKENKTVISEVRSYSKPPAAMHDMLNACLLLFGECEIPYTQWVELQRKCGNTGTDGLGKRISELDIRAVHPEMAARARQIVDSYKSDAILKVTTTAALFHAWVWGVCQEVLINELHFTKPADPARQKEIVRQLRRKHDASVGGSAESSVAVAAAGSVDGTV